MGTLSNMTAAHPKNERSVPLRADISSRILAGVFAMIILAVLTAAAWISPNAEGHGSHTQLGLSPCQWAVWFDKPCPSCGMTTAFAHAGEGSWVQSGATQPFGLLLVIGSAALFWGALSQAATGARVGSALGGMLRPKLFIVLGVLFGAAWMYKIITW